MAFVCSQRFHNPRNVAKGSGTEPTNLVVVSAALDYIYRYATPSVVKPDRVALSTCSSEGKKPYFFEGTLIYPAETAQMLLVLSQVVRTHFFLKPPVILDPVLTSNESLLRLEGFSGCCGVYARVDLPRASFDGDCFGRGTTNVDFNEPMRRALGLIRSQDKVGLSVGQEEVVLERSQERTVEKKVKLPVRWLKSFGEVQSYQPRFKLQLEADASEALKLLRSLPSNSPPKQASYVRRTGRALRLSQRPGKGAVILRGVHRIAVLEPLLLKAQGLRVWADADTEVSGWEVYGPAGRFFLMLSPEVYRGFSGEGQLLEGLAHGVGQELVSRVRAALRWQAHIEVEPLAKELGVAEHKVEGALAILGSRGLAGFDALAGKYFHRELPFDTEQIEKLQPRLKAAKKLVDENGVEVMKDSEYLVKGTDVRHYVRLLTDGDRCSCPWFSKHQGQRGPCKHILAAQIVHDD